MGGQIERNAEEWTPLYLNLGRVLELNSQFEQALKTYQEMENLACQIGDRTMELAALTGQVTILAVPTTVHEPAQARKIGERALTLAKNLGDQQAESKILWSLSLANYLSGRLNEAIACGEQSLALARQLDLRRQMAYTLNDLGSFIYLYSGSIEQSKVALNEARELWQELGNMPMIADSQSGSCVAHVYTGEFDQAKNFSEQALQISQEINNVWGQSYSMFSVGEVYLARGEYSQAIEVMEECIHLGEMAGFVPPQTYTRSYLALTYADVGLLEHALEIVQVGLKISQSQIPLHNAQLLGTLARLHIKNGEIDAAEKTIRIGKNETSRHSWKVFYLPVLMADAELAYYSGENKYGLEIVEEIIKHLNQFGMRSRLAEALYLKGMILAGLTQDKRAQECQLESRAIAEDLGERRILWRVLYALSKLESDSTKSKTCQQAACNVINIVASHIEQEDFRNTFLNQPDIVSVLASNN